MATANEVLEQMEQHPELYVSADVCIVDPVARTISVPDAYRILGVESDESVKVVPFQCPKMVEDDVDLTDFTLYINYVNAGGDFDIYSIENVKESGENITFDWIIRRSVTARRGTIRFILCAKRSDDEGNIIQEWNTTINDECESLEGLEGTPSIADQFPDIIQQILEKLQEITGGPVDQEQIQQAVNDYLTKNPPSGMTTEQQQQLTKNTNDITDLKRAINEKIDKTGWNPDKFIGTDSSGNIVEKEEPTGGNEYFEVLNNVSSGTLTVGIPPNTFNTDNDDWKSVRYGSALQRFMGGNGVAPIIVNKKILIPSGTIYVRMAISNIYGTSVGSYGIFAVSTPILPEEYSEEIEATCEKVAEESVTTDFNIDGDTKKWYVDSIGNIYPYNDTSGADKSVREYCGGIILKKYVIPEGKYGWLTAASILGNTANSHIRWNPAGYPAIFTTDPTDNITQSVNSGEEGESGGQLKPKDEYVEGFMKFIADNSSFQAYFSEYINNFIPLTSKRQTFGKAIYIGGDSLHAYAGGDGFSTSGFVTNWNKYLGFARVTNAGYAGSKWSETTGGGGIKKAKDLISAGTVYDVIILAWGTNDDNAGNGAIDDEASDTEGATMVAAMKWIITNLRNTFKSTAIGVIIPPPKGTEDGMKTRGDLMIQVCELLHVPYVDMRQYVSISDLDSDTVHLGTGAGKYGAAEASLILRICPYGDTLYPGTTN